MEEEEKWFIVAVLYMLFGIYNIIYGAIVEKDVVLQSIGICGIFVGFPQLIRLSMGYPQWFRNLMKRNKVIVTLIDPCSSIGGGILGYFLLGPWGIAVGFIFISIITEILVPFLIE